jgi:hypothetical protein
MERTQFDRCNSGTGLWLLEAQANCKNPASRFRAIKTLGGSLRTFSPFVKQKTLNDSFSKTQRWRFGNREMRILYRYTG